MLNSQHNFKKESQVQEINTCYMAPNQPPQKLLMASSNAHSNECNAYDSAAVELAVIGS